MCCLEGKRYRTFLHVCDVICVTFLFFPIMVMYWRGIWDLWGVFIYPDDVSKRHLCLIPIGGLGVFGYLAAPAVEDWLVSFRKSSVKCYYFLVRLYLYMYALFYMCYWRAIWEAADYYLCYECLGQNALGFLICWTSLMAMGASRTAIFPPFLVSVDTRDDVMTVCTRFGTKAYSIKFIFDCLFTYFIIMTTTICCWRCIWNVITILCLLVMDPILADQVCLGVGFILALIIFALEPPLKKVAIRASKRWWWYKVAWEDFIYTLLFLASVVLWRGAWNCCATYIVPDPHIGGWVNHIAGTVGLMLVQLFSYAGALGCGIDGGEEGGDGVWPIKYFRHYLLDQDDVKEQDDDKEKGAGEVMLKSEPDTTSAPGLNSKLLPANNLQQHVSTA